MGNGARIATVTALFGLLLAGCNKGMAQPNQESRAAGVLFAQFETVFYSEPSFAAGVGTYRKLPERDANLLRIPFAYLPPALDSLGKHISVKLFENSEAVLVGAKDFRAPMGLGRVRSKFCFVVVLKSGNTFQLKEHVSQSPLSAVPRTTVWNWSARLGEFGERDASASSLYATQLSHSYVLVSNDLNELQAVSERLASPDKGAHTMRQIRDWELFRQYKVWGYRRYLHTGIVDRQAAGMSEVTSGAEALIFFVDLEKKVSVLRLLCKPGSEDTPAKINAKAVLPRFRWRGPGVWETTVPLSGDEESFERVFGVIGLFGFGGYV